MYLPILELVKTKKLWYFSNKNKVNGFYNITFVNIN